ncbi:MAG: hypothetical protein M3299_10655 [Thermoproteota archaeon]|nr:hypothetical protein [Thermoproteota archaeon]
MAESDSLIIKKDKQKRRKEQVERSRVMSADINACSSSSSSSISSLLFALRESFYVLSLGFYGAVKFWLAILKRVVEVL